MRVAISASESGFPWGCSSTLNARALRVAEIKEPKSTHYFGLRRSMLIQKLFDHPPTPSGEVTDDLRGCALLHARVCIEWTWG